MRYLIDTNVLREYSRPSAHPNVLKWFSSIDDHELAISAWTLKEIRKGIEMLRKRKPQEAFQIEQNLVALVHVFQDRILSVDAQVPDALGAMLADSGKHADDTVLAATAKVHRGPFASPADAEKFIVATSWFRGSHA